MKIKLFLIMKCRIGSGKPALSYAKTKKLPRLQRNFSMLSGYHALLSNSNKTTYHIIRPLIIFYFD